MLVLRRFLLVLSLVVASNARPLVRFKRQFGIPGLGGGGIPGLGGGGSGISSFPGLSQPSVVQPAAGQPCPVALVPKQFGGGLKFGAPTNIGFNVAGQNAKDGPWGTGFDTSFGKEYGGSIFGDAGHEALPLECQDTAPAPGNGGNPNPNGNGNPGGVQPVQPQPGSNPNDPFAKAIRENPDLVQKALGQPQPQVSPALRDAVYRRLTKDSAVLKQFVADHSDSINNGLRSYGYTQALSNEDLVQLLASNPQLIAAFLDASPALVKQTADKYSITEDWDKQPEVKERWNDEQQQVFDAFRKDPFLMEEVFIKEDLWVKAALAKGKFDVGGLSDTEVRQALYDNPTYIQTLISRDLTFSRHVKKKYNIHPYKTTYTRKNKSRSEQAYDFLQEDHMDVLKKVFEENTELYENAMIKQTVNPQKVTIDQVVDSYKQHPELLKLMLLQNPELVEKIMYEKGFYVVEKPLSQSEIDKSKIRWNNDGAFFDPNAEDK